ncbi:MAG: CapA family protein [Bacteroidales bacterium]|nr:CapA family protein [Bacteroidales bacterium]
MRARKYVDRQWLWLSSLMIVWMVAVVIFSLTMNLSTKLKKELEEQEERQAYLADSLVTILFAGDVMGHAPQWKAAYDPATGTYDYHDCFRYVEPYISSVDLACANLEVTLAGPPYTSYPCFSSPDELLFALDDVGFDVLFTANNHVLDHGKWGLERTIRMLDSVEMIHAGSYVDTISRDTTYPLVVDVRGLKVGFLNMTYGTNGLRTREPNIVNSMDTTEVIRDFERLDELDADLKVVFIHWGNEYQLQADRYQRRYAQFLVRHGADLIIGGHPHVSQDADTLYAQDGKPVVTYFSMGNFVSNQRKPNTNGGIMIQVTVNRFTGRVVATNYIPYYVHRGYIHGKYQYYVVPTIPYINNWYDFRLNRMDSIALVTVHRAMTERLSDFIPIFAADFEIEDK